MKAEFEFDGDSLRLYIKVEDRCEIALAKVIAKYSRATVTLSYAERHMYSSYSRDEDPTGVSIVLREAPKCLSTGTWCELDCVAMEGCKMAAQQASSSDAASSAEQKGK